MKISGLNVHFAAQAPRSGQAGRGSVSGSPRQESSEQNEALLTISRMARRLSAQMQRANAAQLVAQMQEENAMQKMSDQAQEMIYQAQEGIEKEAGYDGVRLPAQQLDGMARGTGRVMWATLLYQAVNGELGPEEHNCRILSAAVEDGERVREREKAEGTRYVFARIRVVQHRTRFFDLHLRPQGRVLMNHDAWRASDRIETVSLWFPEDIADFGLQLSRLDVLPWLDDVGNFARLANKYAEIRQSLEEEYYGDELEAQLKRLSQAFDMTVQFNASVRAVEISFRLEEMKYALSWLGGMPGFSQEQFMQLSERLTVGVEEAVSHFARLARQFVLENGSVLKEQDKALLEKFLRSEQRGQGRLSFDDLRTIDRAATSGVVPGQDAGTVLVNNFNELLRIRGDYAYV